MSKTIEAIYENGVLKPLNTIDLKEHESELVKFLVETIKWRPISLAIKLQPSPQRCLPVLCL